jgi:uncharacterized protein
MENAITGEAVQAAVTGQSRKGIFLEYKGEEILLPAEEVNKPAGDYAEVFIYEDKQGKLTATMNIPTVTKSTYDWVYVVGGIDAGVFVDIGLPKDILVSKDDLPEAKELWPQKGDRLFVTLAHDRMKRLKAMPISEDMIEEERDLAQNEFRGSEVRGNVYGHKDAGTCIITEEGVRGFIHESEAAFIPRLGQSVEGRVIAVKEDGTINVTLRDERVVAQGKDADLVLEVLQKRGGQMPFTDKSTPEEIQSAFGLSKASFKRALGKLMKEKIISQEPGRTYLIDKEQE